jgi:hypothetical protein
MDRLVTVAKVRARLTASDNVKVNALITDVLSAATLHLQDHMLQDDFAVGDHTEVFYLRSGYENAQAGMPTLGLKNGYVNSITSVKYGSVRSELNTEGVAVADKNIITDLLKGTVKIDLTDIGTGTYFFEVKYNSGFTISNGVFTGVPERLQEVAILQAMNLYRYSNDSDEEPFPIAHLIEQLMRWYPAALKAVA